MPGRVARSNTAAAPKTARNKNKKRSFDAYSAAQKQITEKRLIPKHRLGEDIDDEPRQKRRRAEDDEEEDELVDVEEDLDQRTRKPKQRRATGQDDNLGYGSDSSGNEWTMGAIAEDDDESDLDSDEAFGESDDEFQQGFTFRGSSSKKTKSKKKPTPSASSRKLDLNEREESEDDDGESEDDEGLGFGDDAVDLAAMLDNEDEDMDGGEDDDGEESDDVSAGDDEESEEESEEEDDDMADEERVARMRDRIEAMSGSSREAPAVEPLEDVTLDDFMEDIGLAPEKTTTKGKKKQVKTGPIAAPLPKRQQDRIDREIATEKAKQELDKWRDTVTRNRRAEHLSFPLQDPADQGVTLGREKFQPATQQKPQTELEESIQRIMEESGLAAKQDQDGDHLGGEESALLKAEGLAEKKMPVEEVMARRAELRRQRELLFREEIKAKRIAKIKSKSYRRVHRKERERQAEQERLELEGMGMSGMDETAEEQFDRKRAEARMGTKHKDSKWAKTLKQTNRTAWDEGARDGVVEQARRNEELKKRMAGQDVSSDEDGSLPSADEDEDDDEADVLRQLASAKDSAAEKKGLSALKFMRNAEERKRKANDEDVERLRRELAVADGDEEESDAEGQDLGRAIFGPQSKENKPVPKEQRLEFEAPEGSDEDDDDEARIVTEQPKTAEKTTPKGTLKKANAASGPLAKGLLKEDEAKQQPSSATNAWLQAPKNKSKKPRSTNDDSIIITNADPISPAAPSKGKAAAEPQPTSASTSGNTYGWTTVTYKNDGDSDAEEEEPSNPILTAKEQQLSIQQRAFAGDDVQAAFEAEKADQIASEDEKEVSTHLPGWGSWTGDGLSRSIRKANKKAAHNPLWKTKLDGVKQADRKDARLANVIVSEKADRKGKKYLAPVLPHQYETKEQYERSRRLPMGPEWTTKEVHQRMTKPRIVVKKGVNVKALERPIA
ncbi:U3 small nucleolar RNA-associated protein 14 [Fulvia fulva]|uniref:U3 small nucleolar RNA-associated protein 14 n=1 Tax=Passalora fulva TaxID=5499 RepID=A0A9Q8LIT7_PASFU|nr:U3 small nucleolar RNA-associated protein 14 [Fulvia fulva]KAK4625415.1 U3 small nucleolar RNA-associated protein 14 [Fulvia fulva]UJO18168.1 U3 small nucleolar RNA-associated protein 14 [Fulvia fulva]